MMTSYHECHQYELENGGYDPDWDSEPKIGEVWNVKPWWSGVAQLPCKINKMYGSFWDVVPLEGNPHIRSVRKELFIDRIGGHPAETVQ